MNVLVTVQAPDAALIHSAALAFFFFSSLLLSSLELSDTPSMSLKCEPSSEPLHIYVT